MSNIIIYEHPLNERMRFFMRLEHLFRQAAYTLRGYSVWDSRSTLASLTAILDILSRGDLKTELLKELERQQKALLPLTNVPEVDTEQLRSILNQIQSAEQQLHNYTGQLGQELKDHELLNTLRQRSSIVGGTCNFDIPLLHFWLKRSPEYRIEQLENWLDKLTLVSHPISLVLDIIRESTVAKPQTADAGFYQLSIEKDAPVQLIRIGLDEQTNCFPEVSAGKHRFSIRFLAPQDANRPIQTNADIAFQLSICAL